jgi:hypothetical protein
VAAVRIASQTRIKKKILVQLATVKELDTHTYIYTYV